MPSPSLELCHSGPRAAPPPKPEYDLHGSPSSALLPQLSQDLSTGQECPPPPQPPRTHTPHPSMGLLPPSWEHGQLPVPGVKRRRWFGALKMGKVIFQKYKGLMLWGLQPQASDSSPWDQQELSLERTCKYLPLICMVFTECPSAQAAPPAPASPTRSLHFPLPLSLPPSCPWGWSSPALSG